jgi:hypothetical protein
MEDRLDIDKTTHRQTAMLQKLAHIQASKDPSIGIRHQNPPLTCTQRDLK